MYSPLMCQPVNVGSGYCRFPLDVVVKVSPANIINKNKDNVRSLSNSLPLYVCQVRVKRVQVLILLYVLCCVRQLSRNDARYNDCAYTVALNKVQGKKNGTKLWKRDYYRP